jgi:hypothetical protein
MLVLITALSPVFGPIVRASAAEFCLLSVRVGGRVLLAAQPVNVFQITLGGG